MNLLPCTLALIVLLLGCHETQTPPLRIGVNPWVGYDPLILAREHGWVDAHQVQIVELMSSTESARALNNGLLDGATLTLDEALRLADAGMALKIVAVLDTSFGADAIVASPEIKTLADLKGKRIALEETAVGALMLDFVLSESGLRADEVQTVHVEAAQHANILVEKAADAVITFEPIKSQLLAAGFHSLFDSRQVADQIIDVLVVKADLDPGLTANVLQAWERGRQAMEMQAEAAANLLAPGIELSPEQYLASLQGLRFVPLAQSEQWLRGPNAPLIKRAERLVKTLQALDLLKHAPDWPRLLHAGAAEPALESAP